MRAIWSADKVGKVASGRSTRNCGVDIGPDTERATRPTLASPRGAAVSLGQRRRDPDVEYAHRDRARASAVLHLTPHAHHAAGNGVDPLPDERLSGAHDECRAHSRRDAVVAEGRAPHAMRAAVAGLQ